MFCFAFYPFCKRQKSAGEQRKPWIMFNFSQAARGNVGKVNQADRFTPTHTPHTRPGGPRAPGEEKKKMKMEKHVDSDQLQKPKSCRQEATGES